MIMFRSVEFDLPSLAPINESRPAAILPLVAVLGQLNDLLNSMSDEQYAQKPVGGVPSSVGGHVRHCLDHVEALLSAIDTGVLNYDDRKRGTDIETNRGAAIDAIAWQQRQLFSLSGHVARQPLRMSALVSPALPAVVVDTSVGRELSFVLSHTIHHNALIGVMAKALNVPLPDRFGYAPSTIAHLEASRCVQ